MPQRQNNRRNRSAIAVTGCALGLALIVVGFGVGSSSKHEPASAPKEETPVKKKLPTWNLALGDVVIVARDLGFSVSPRETAEEAKVLARIDGQLQSIRELYRHESEKDQSLLGGILLQLTTNGAGEVANVKELNSRIVSSDFRKSIVSEAAKWSFEDVLAEPTVIRCPLLFVREGMDVTTLVNWERLLGGFGELPVLGRNDSVGAKNDRSGVLENVKAAVATKASVSPAAVTSRAAAAATSGSAYQIKYATTIRKEPSFSSTAVAKFPVGTRVALIGKAGDWLKVSYADGGPVGFLRKEFVVPVTLAKQ